MAHALIEKRSPHRRRALDGVLFNLPLGVVISDPEGYVLNVNPFFTSMTGYTLQEVKHDTVEKLLNGPLTDVLALKKIAISLGQKTQFMGQLLHYRKNGSIFLDQYSISPIFNSAGELANFISLSQVMTDMIPHTSSSKAMLSVDEMDALFGSQLS